MPKTAHIPAYCLHKPSGRAYIRIHGRVRYHLGDYDSPASREAYGRLLAELAAAPGSARRRGDRRGDDRSELILAYWEFCSGYYLSPDYS